MNSNKVKATLAVLPATLALLGPAMLSTPAQAGFFHHHPGAAGLGAAIAAHHMAKHSGSAGHRNIMQRHPMMTGLAAGAAAHHFFKKH